MGSGIAGALRVPLPETVKVVVPKNPLPETDPVAPANSPVPPVKIKVWGKGPVPVGLVSGAV